jgi:hypothetical protein
VPDLSVFDFTKILQKEPRKPCPEGENRRAFVKSPKSLTERDLERFIVSR